MCESGKGKCQCGGWNELVSVSGPYFHHHHDQVQDKLHAI